MVTGMKLSEIVNMNSAAKEYAVNRGIEDIKRIVFGNDNISEAQLKFIKGMVDVVALHYEEFILHYVDNITNIMDEAQKKESAINDTLRDLIKSEE